MPKSRGILRPRKKWTSDELSLLTYLYPFTKTDRLARFFGCELHQVFRAAYSADLKKSKWFADSPMAQRLRGPGDIGKSYRFPKGNIPANKGKKCKSHPNAVATQFKAGQKPHTWRPIGSVRITKDGYSQVKILDTGYPPRDWIGVHILVWQRLHGKEVPKNHMIRMRDRNKINVAPENLELLSQAENMKRNTYHNYGKEIAQLYQLKGAIKRQINKQERIQNEQ